MEIELKLEIAPEHVPALRAHPLLAHYATGPARTRTLTNTYYDTADGFLRRHRCALRVRRGEGGRIVQTFKGGGGVEAGLHRREEWETALGKPEPDLVALRAQIADGPWRDLLAAPELTGLRAVFTTDFRRSTWLLRSANGDLVELALDAGQVRSGAHSEPLCEVEMELKEGAPSCLFELADALGRAVPLAPSDVSKAQRGYALFARGAA